MMTVPDWLRSCATVKRLAGLVRSGGPCSAHGAHGSSTTVAAAALGELVQRPVLLVVAHLDEADEACDELTSFGFDAATFPALEILPGETGINIDLLSERLRLISALRDQSSPRIIIAPIQALMQAVPDDEQLARLRVALRGGQTMPLQKLIEWLADAGFQRVDAVDSPGDYSIRGGIIDIFSPGGSPPVRVDFFGDDIEAMWEIDPDTMGSDRRIEHAEIISAKPEAAVAGQSGRSLADLLPGGTIAVLVELLEINEQARGYFERVIDARGVIPQADVFAKLSSACHAVVDISQYSAAAADAVNLPVAALPSFAEETGVAIGELAELAQSSETIVYCQNEGERARFMELAEEFASGAPLRAEVAYLHRGFLWEMIEETGEPKRCAFVPYHELVHRYHARRRLRRVATGRAIDTFLDLEPGDFVVHREHGIAKFISFGPLREKATRGKSSTEEYLTLEFAGGSKLHVPASQISVVQKYVGGFKGRPELSKLGGRKWKKQKEDVADAVRDLAGQMLRIQAAREHLPGVRYPADTAWQREFEAEFPYEETEDQLAAVAAVKGDMTAERPMDRLLCGDVGFGKTEIAIRAAFKAAEYGKQVAVLVPTTVLAEQHEQTFRQRFADYPFRIESISRFKTKKEQSDVLKEVRAGRIDIVIGTHRLLSKDVKFADLGLVVIDEEQRFGVEHKQRLLQFRMTADVLTLSATPIPRTLHMSMLGLRDISSLATPPADRRAIVTEVIPYDERRIRQAIERELAREGQVFFVHNRVHNILSVADDVRRLAPDARIVVGHGQMSSRELERVMLRFMRRQADILVCTTIIESGIDIPTANTMFINDADLFGLSDLHQLRGRVGRYKHRAYCYLMLPDDRTVTEAAVRRLRAIEEYTMLGAGFKIAMRDLEIRGAGNLLGPEQSGHISAVGYEMYCELLQQAVGELKAAAPPPKEPSIVDLGISGALTKNYIPSDQRRLEAYRRLSAVQTIEEFDEVEHDLLTAYGEPPKNAATLLGLARIRVLAATIGVRSIVRHADDVIFRTSDPRALESLMAGVKGSVRLVGQPDESGLTEVYYRPPRPYLESSTLLPLLRRRLSGEATRPAVAGAVG